MSKNNIKNHLNRLKLNNLYFLIKLISELELPSQLTENFYEFFLLIYKLTDIFQSFFWYVIASVNLALRIKKRVDFFLEIIYIQYQLLNRKKFNIFWPLHFDQENNIIKYKKMIQLAENYILKILKFRIFIKNTKNILKFYKFKSLYYNIKKKYPLFINFPELTFMCPLTSFMSTSCDFFSKIWFDFGFIRKDCFPWWRYFNIREAELEYFDQTLTRIYCSTELKFSWEDNV
nr:hypothetical protein 1634Bnrm2_p066 [Cryptomonas sp.]